MKIGKSIDVTEIENEPASDNKKLKALERNKKNLEKDIDSLLDDDKFANRKRADMNTRLDKICEDMDSVEREWIDCLNRLQAVQVQQLNEKKIKFAFDIENIGEILDHKGNHVETVVLLES